MKNFISKFVLRKGKVVVFLEVKNIPLTMDLYPATRRILRKNLPSIFKSVCFNPEKLSFYKESKKTEIGHLFEHVLIEHMCLIKIPYVDEISYAGRTYWNTVNSNGRFRVEITCNLVDWPIFLKALNKSTLVMDKIINSGDSIKDLNTDIKTGSDYNDTQN